MINILPPDLKQQIGYSKRNLVLAHYLTLVITVAIGLSLAVGGSYWYAKRQINQLNHSLADRQKQRAAYKDTAANVATLQANLGSIEKLYNEKTQYSAVLADFAAVLPGGSYISAVTLTGDDTKPLELIISADSINTAGLVRNGLLKSARLKSVDVQSITKDEKTGRFTVDLVAAFKEGQAR